MHPSSLRKSVPRIQSSSIGATQTVHVDRLSPKPIVTATFPSTSISFLSIPLIDSSISGGWSSSIFTKLVYIWWLIIITSVPVSIVKVQGLLMIKPSTNTEPPHTLTSRFCTGALASPVVLGPVKPTVVGLPTASIDSCFPRHYC